MGTLKTVVSALRTVFSRATHTVDIVRDTKTGTVTREQWWKGGKLDRSDGPAFSWRNAQTGILTCEQWWKGGKLDRSDGPAFIVRNAATGAVTDEEWWKNGKQIKPPAPATQATTAPPPQL
jgi:hypothetical protein